MTEFDFGGTVVAVTGAGHGFGRAIARSFAALGAQVFACDLSAEELEETADHPGAIHTSAFDLTAPGAAKAWIADVEKHAEAPVGVLASNAGGVRGQVMRPIEDVPESDWHDVVEHQPACAFPAGAGGGARHEARRRSGASSPSAAAPGCNPAAPASRPIPARSTG